MKYIRNNEITIELDKYGRTYLAGDLKLPTDLQYMKTDGTEIGISKYKVFQCDQAHTHQWNFEFNYVLTGEIKVFIFDENKEYHFKKGDIFQIESSTSYMTKCVSGTEILFIKTPGGNDKEIFDISKNSDWVKWTKEW